MVIALCATILHAHLTRRYRDLDKALAAICRKSIFRILAVAEVGHLPDSINITFLGTLNAVKCSLHFLIMSSAVYLAFGFNSTNAVTASPHLASGTPTTCARTTPGNSFIRKISISEGETFSPPVLIISFLRPTK